MKKVGLVINPIAGMGGSVGLKGTDGVLQRALELGARPKAHERAMKALEILKDIRDNIEILTSSGHMGETEAKECGFKTRVVWASEGERTGSFDTIRTAEAMIDEGVDLILFAGGDGTARDIYNAVKERAVVIGIPAGVKIHSPIFAQNPLKAGELAKLFLEDRITQTQEVEVLDIDEEEYRMGRVNTRLYGYLKIPFEKKYMQNRKAGTPLSERAVQYAIAYDVIDNMEDDRLYIIGPGTTTRAVMEKLELPCTLIGVDIIFNKKLIALDASEKRILEEMRGRKCSLIVTPTGGQGYLFGRGNQQLSPEVLKKIGKQNIIVIAGKQKITELKGQPLLVDTGDSEVDEMLCGYMRVTTGYREQVVYRVKS